MFVSFGPEQRGALDAGDGVAVDATGGFGADGSGFVVDIADKQSKLDLSAADCQGNWMDFTNK